MQAKGAYRSMSPLAVAMAYAVGLVASVVPALISVYNPHQYATDPIFEPVAVRNVLVAVAVAAPLAWWFGRFWPRPLVNRLAGAGVALTLASGIAVGIASSQPMSAAGPYLSAATLLATLAIPSTALVTVAILKQGGAK